MASCTTSPAGGGTSAAPTTAFQPAPRGTPGGSAGSATTTPGPPYPVARQTVDLVDPSRPTVSQGVEVSPVRALTTLVWMPAGAGRWPLVVFAHGYQVGPEPYEAMLEAWAAHGYVVAAPEFPLTDQAVAGSALDESDLANQPADVRFVTDALLGPQGGGVEDHVDPGRVAVAGHSDGGETALAAAGDAVPDGEPPYRAVICMSAQPLDPPGSNPPILVVQGDSDTVNPPEEGYATYDSAGSPKYLLVLEGGGHLAPLEAGSQWLPGVVAVTEAFLDSYVAGDQPVSEVGAAAAAASTVMSLRSS